MEHAEEPPDNGQGDGAQDQDGGERRNPAAPRRASFTPNLELREIRKGTKPGSRYVRLAPRREQPFRRTSEGEYQATSVATQPRNAPERLWRGFKRIIVGAPLATAQAEEQKISKTKALAVFSSDALSSSAYATDEILLVLITAGTGALTHSIEIALAIGALLAIVTFSYRQTIRAYPNGGGAYIVARENLGNAPGLTAAAALSVDYVLTVSVSIAAGMFAITSAFPELHDERVPIAIAIVAFITLANIRGIRESATIFAIPTYAFIIAFAVLLIGGFVRLIINPDLQADVAPSAVQAGTASLTPFLLLRAFSSGSAALTGVEAISNGIPAFKKPESRNAATTLLIMAAVLTTFFIGLTILAHELDVRHAERISVPAQIAKAVYGENIIFYFIQGATALILLLAANTSYADFPRLSSILAKDKFLPHQFSFRGDRLAFSHGIIVLGIAASVLLGVFQADVDKLIPLYAFGVFVSFTLSQSGMVLHWLRLKEPGWKQSIVINLVGAVATGIVAIIVGATKFGISAHEFGAGAWISMVMMAALAFMFWRIHGHYQRVAEQLTITEAPELPPAPAPASARVPTDPMRARAVVVPVDELNKATLRALEYACSISDNVSAVHVTDELEDGEQLRRRWEELAPRTPIVVIESPYRSFIAPMLAY
ncbi:MAG: APC family permease, partial [Dehalococcoidia bacterium]